MMPRRRETKVLLSLDEVRAAFEQQNALAVKDALGVIHEAQFFLGLEPNVVAVPPRASTYVFGDIHGQFFDLMRLMDAAGVAELLERDTQLLFLGDYVDRGAFSCEVMLYLLLLKIRFPDKVVLLRGNHECESISSFYGFRNECRVKYGISVYYHFLSCFQSMPVAALLPTPRGNILCVHGGISPELKTIEDIQAIDRRREVPTTGPLCDLLWADPLTQSVGVENEVDTQSSWEPNQARGCSYYFNAAAMFEFLANNQLISMLRAHEYEDEGFMFHFNSDEFRDLDNRQDKSMPPLITVFSAPNYCDSYGNMAAYLAFRTDPFSWKVELVKTVGHPAPPIASAERGSDMWRLFNQTLPFLPASKEFFEEVLWLSDGQRAAKSDTRAPHSPVADNDVLATAVNVVDSDDENPAERRRRLTSEMHPQAIRKVLDDEVQKWELVEDKSTHAAGHDSPPRIVRRPSLSNMEEPQEEEDDRPSLLTNQELDTIKLMFSLMDTDGSLELSSTKVSQFILNILGEKISSADADRYLDALDYDRNGVVDFADILSWVAVMKASRNKHDSNRLLSWAAMLNGVRLLAREIDFSKVSLWLAFGCLLRDIIVPKQRKVIKSSSIRLLGAASLVLYVLDLLSGGSIGRERRLLSLQQAVNIVKQRFLS
ncbi:Serine/threonine-protein phosphatase [Phytophthora cinnamomi]|uniref:Serine/threonine-protein phosphatase n=1 Tax=Phytophthora cinnamomi TaxID=4785 RepID=UPI00355A95E4|nr:Serine/threonine-protein phosphatase [Phytophthora cinnamomi]